MSRGPPREGAELAILPEYFCLMGRSDRDKLAIAEAPGSGPIQAMLAETAREHRLWLVAGTLPLQSGEEGRAMNANLVFSPTANASRATTRSTSSATTTGASSTTRAAPSRPAARRSRSMRRACAWA